VDLIQAFKAQEMCDMDVMTRINASYVSAEEVHRFITQLGISKVCNDVICQ